MECWGKVVTWADGAFKPPAHCRLPRRETDLRDSSVVQRDAGDVG